MNENEKLGKAIDEAARDLPEGYVIYIAVEKGAGGCRMQKPDGTEISCDAESLSEEIKDLVLMARYENQSSM